MAVSCHKLNKFFFVAVMWWSVSPCSQAPCYYCFTHSYARHT